MSVTDDRNARWAPGRLPDRAAAGPHEHSHPAVPPAGTFSSPGPCGCGLTAPQTHLAETLRVIARDVIAGFSPGKAAELDLYAAALETEMRGDEVHPADTRVEFAAVTGDGDPNGDADLWMIDENRAYADAVVARHAGAYLVARPVTTGPWVRYQETALEPVRDFLAREADEAEARAEAEERGEVAPAPGQRPLACTCPDDCDLEH